MSSYAARLALAVIAALSLAPIGSSVARAEPRQAEDSAAKAQPAWCDAGIEALSEDLCHIDGGSKDGRRTLVIFLHGAIARNVTWQFTQERALLRQAKQSGFTALFPRAPLGPTGYVWQLPAQDRDATETRLIEHWRAAQRTLEARQGKPFDDVFVMGFSSGAYFVGSLALRGKMHVDGYATFAGGMGAPGPGQTPLAHKAPLFVGVCADDRQTADDSRSLANIAGMRGLPFRIDEQHIGHMFGDLHVAHAVSYLRGEASKRREK